MDNLRDDIFAVDETDEEVYTQAVEEEEEPVSAIGTLKLVRPITMDGKELKSLRYDFDKLSPKTYTEIVKKVSRKENVTIPSLNLSIQANMFCKAAGIPAAIISTQMSIPDFEAACALARDFLLSNSASTDDDLI